MVDMRHLLCYTLHQVLWEQCAVACKGLSHLSACLLAPAAAAAGHAEPDKRRRLLGSVGIS